MFGKNRAQKEKRVSSSDMLNNKDTRKQIMNLLFNTSRDEFSDPNKVKVNYGGKEYTASIIDK